MSTTTDPTPKNPPPFSIPMRGNEHATRLVLQVHAGAFSIPMRGNEWARSGSRAVASWFSIPMRGNETGLWEMTALAMQRFSIPMRGNELQGILLPPAAEVEFSIPMRGNEILNRSWESALTDSFRSP